LSQVCVRNGCRSAAIKEIVSNPAITYCPNCGDRLQPFVVTGLTDGTSAQVSPLLPPPTISRSSVTGARIVAFLLDEIIGIILGTVALVPVIGQLVGGFLLTVFWLFRDVNGGSPGKMALGLVVVNRSGGASTIKQRITRNLPFAISIAPLVVPFVGYEIAIVLELIAITLEVGSLLFTGDRLADRLVGTTVAKRPR
jgi:uncharacterized RDD family membrane protein YckC